MSRGETNDEKRSLSSSQMTKMIQMCRYTRLLASKLKTCQKKARMALRSTRSILKSKSSNHYGVTIETMMQSRIKTAKVRTQMIKKMMERRRKTRRPRDLPCNS